MLEWTNSKLIWKKLKLKKVRGFFKFYEDFSDMLYLNSMLKLT